MLDDFLKRKLNMKNTKIKTKRPFKSFPAHKAKTLSKDS